MKALILTDRLTADTLEIRELDVPEPGTGQVRLKVRACGLNPVDHKVAPGKKPGEVLGIDVTGIVDALGPGVPQVAVGDRVAVHLDVSHGGGLAEYCLAPADVLAPIPEAVSDVDAAAIPCAGMTAFQSIDRRLRVTRDDVVLVTAAAGGVGGFAVQLAALRGARVIGTASESNHETVRELGADEVIDYRTEDVPARVRALTDGRGVDAVVETVGTATELLPTLAFGGGMAAITGRPDWDAVPQFTTAPSVHEIALGAAHRHGDAHARAELRDMLVELLDLVAAGRLDPRVTRTFGLDGVAQAYAELADGHVAGKLVAVP